VLSPRAEQKIRDQDKGHEYAEKILIGHGARPMRAGQTRGHGYERRCPQPAAETSGRTASTGTCSRSGTARSGDMSV
jgi:hypothetical protein